MATRNISITDEAYKRLAVLRKANESFSELIISVTKKGKLSDCAGLLTKEEGDSLEKNILENKAMRMKLRSEKLKIGSKT